MTPEEEKPVVDSTTTEADPQPTSQTKSASTNAQLDMEQNKLFAILAYVCFLVPIFAAPQSPYVKFHTLQGINLVIWGILGSILIFIFHALLGLIPIIGWILAPVLGFIVGAVFIVLWIAWALLGMFRAWTGSVMPLPLIGNALFVKDYPWQD